MKNTSYTYTCWIMWRRLSSESNTHFLRKPHDQPYPHLKTNYGVKVQYAKSDDTSLPLGKEVKNPSKKFWVFFFIMWEQFILQCLLHFYQLLHNRPIQLRPLWKSSINSLYMRQHILTLYSPTVQATWSFPHTAMNSTSLNTKQRIEWVAISICLTTPSALPTMAPSSP